MGASWWANATTLRVISKRLGLLSPNIILTHLPGWIWLGSEWWRVVTVLCHRLDTGPARLDPQPTWGVFTAGLLHLWNTGVSSSTGNLEMVLCYSHGNVLANKIGLTFVVDEMYLHRTRVVSSLVVGSQLAVNSIVSSPRSAGPSMGLGRHPTPPPPASNPSSKSASIHHLDCLVRHFPSVAKLQGWNDIQKAIQMVSYLDEQPMNVTQLNKH